MSEPRIPSLPLTECTFFQTVRELLHRAEQLKTTPLDVVERIVGGKIPDIKPPVKRKLANFAEAIRDLRKYANEVRCFIRVIAMSV